jgi:hypothetical protein
VVSFLLTSGCGGDGATATDGSVGQDAGADGAVTPDAPPALPDGCEQAAALRTSCEGTLANRYDASATIAKGCYRAATTPVLGASTTLTLAPGVTIIFAKGAGLTVSGDQVLVAQGTAAEPICLTGATATRGAWDGITYSMTASDANVLDYVTVEYAGDTTSDATAAAITVTADSRGASFSMSRSTVRESQGFGISWVGSSRIGGFAGNVLTKNTLGPACLDAEVVRFLDGASTYAGNDRDLITVRSYRLVTAATWAALDVPFYLAQGLQAAVALTVTPPATFIMAQDTAIGITGGNGSAGALVAAGTAQEPILFTGEQKVRGHWNGISFTNTNAANRLAYVTVEYAGKLLDGNVALSSTGFPTSVELSHCTLRESLGFGLWTENNSLLPGFDANVLTQNAKGPARAYSGKVHQLLPSSTYTDNDVDEIWVDSYSVDTATWSDLGVPYRMAGIGRVHIDGVWTLLPGVVLVMTQDGWLSVGCDDVCAFHAAGTAAQPIVITGAEQTRGYWEAIRFNGSSNSSNLLDYVTVEYGGGTSEGDPAEVTALTDSRGYTITVTHSTIQHSASGGIALSGGSNAHWNADIATSNTFADNAGTNVIFPP